MGTKHIVLHRHPSACLRSYSWAQGAFQDIFLALYLHGWLLMQLIKGSEMETEPIPNRLFPAQTTTSYSFTPDWGQEQNRMFSSFYFLHASQILVVYFSISVKSWILLKIISDSMDLDRLIFCDSISLSCRWEQCITWKC